MSAFVFLVGLGVLGDAAVDKDKSKSGVVFSGRPKKRLATVTKVGRAGGKVPWARLISQHPQVCFGHFLYELGFRPCLDERGSFCMISISSLLLHVRFPVFE